MIGKNGTLNQSKSILNQSKSGALGNAGGTLLDGASSSSKVGIAGFAMNRGANYPPLYDRSHLIYQHKGVSMEGLPSYGVTSITKHTHSHTHHETSLPERKFIRRRRPKANTVEDGEEENDEKKPQPQDADNEHIIDAY